MKEAELRRRAIGGGSAEDEREVYLMANALTYLDTGVRPNASTSAEWKAFSTGSNGRGQVLSTQGNVMLFFLYGSFPACQRGDGSKWIQGSYQAKFARALTPRVFSCWRNGNNAVIDGEVVITTPYYGAVSGTLKLFNKGNSSADQHYGGVAYAKIWDGDTLIRDYVPKVVGGVAGMYDKVNKTFSPSVTENPFAGIAILENGQLTYI